MWHGQRKQLVGGSCVQLSRLKQTLHNAALRLRMYFTREHVIWTCCHKMLWRLKVLSDRQHQQVNLWGRSLPEALLIIALVFLCMFVGLVGLGVGVSPPPLLAHTLSKQGIWWKLRAYQENYYCRTSVELLVFFLLKCGLSCWNRMQVYMDL